MITGYWLVYIKCYLQVLIKRIWIVTPTNTIAKTIRSIKLSVANIAEHTIATQRKTRVQTFILRDIPLPSR